MEGLAKGFARGIDGSVNRVDGGIGMSVDGGIGKRVDEGIDGSVNGGK